MAEPTPNPRTDNAGCSLLLFGVLAVSGLAESLLSHHLASLSLVVCDWLVELAPAQAQARTTLISMTLEAMPVSGPAECLLSHHYRLLCVSVGRFTRCRKPHVPAQASTEHRQKIRRCLVQLLFPALLFPCIARATPKHRPAQSTARCDEL